MTEKAAAMDKLSEKIPAPASSMSPSSRKRDESETYGAQKHIKAFNDKKVNLKFDFNF
jgi:hypothetical protein